MMCEKMIGEEQIKEVRVGKVLGVDGRMQELEETVIEKIEKVIEKKEEELVNAEPVTVLAGPIEGPAVNNSGLSLYL